MVSWLLKLTWNKPPTEEQNLDYVNRMFATLDTNKNDKLEPEEIIKGYAAFPPISECFEQLSDVYGSFGLMVKREDNKPVAGELIAVQTNQSNHDGRACCSACSIQ